jgi:hypothetical protein
MNYQLHREELIDLNNKRYHEKIGNLTPEELKTYRKRRSDYFKCWYKTKCESKGQPYQPRIAFDDPNLKVKRYIHNESVTTDISFSFAN